MCKYLLPWIAFFAMACGRAITPEVPQLPASGIDSVPLPDSRIDVPFNIDLDSIIADLDRKIPIKIARAGIVRLGGSLDLRANAGELVKNPLVRKVIEPYWAKLFQPVRIGDIGYLSMNPSEIQLEHLTGSVHLLSATLGVTARPVFSLSNPGPPATVPPLPTILREPASGFRLYVDARIQYAALNQLLKEHLAISRFVVGGTGSIVIKRAELYGEGNHHLLVRVDFRGREHGLGFRGRLYLTCLPVYDQASGLFYVSDLHFDTYSKANLLARAGNWILNSGLETFLNKQIRFDLGSQIDGVRKQLNTAINKPIAPKMFLSGEIDGLSLSGILPVEDCVLMRFVASGRLAVTQN